MESSPNTCVIVAIVGIIVFSQGRGIPNLLAQECNHAKQIHPSLVPSLEEAVQLYESSGGHLTPLTTFGSDPLAGHDDLQRIRQRAMEESIPSPEELFSTVVNGMDVPFAQSIQFMVDKTSTLLQL